jgi:uncharacterized membrane protein YdjX (TVP38/TMEM64 family)
VEAERISSKTIAVTAISFVALTLILTIGIQTIGADNLRAMVENAGPLAPVLYIIVRAATFVIAPLSSGPLGFSAGILFGLWQGTVLTLLAEVIGGSINFWIARKLGRPVVARFVGRGGIGRVEQLYNQLGSPWMLVYARLFLFAAYDFISYAAGMTRLKYRDYLLVTAIVGIVPTVISVGIGASISDFQHLIVLYIGMAVVSGATFLLYGRVRRFVQRVFHLEDKPVTDGDALARNS